MLRLKVVGRVAVLAAALSLSGCAAAFGGYDLAPNGLPRDEEALRHSLAVQADELYGEIIGGERALPDDDLLRLLYAGTAGYYGGNLRESSRLLDLASYVAEDRVTFHVSRQMLSMITSDRTLAYTPGRTERLMIPYMAALTYLEAGDFDGAAVEARRIEALLDRMDDGVPPAEILPESRFLHYFAGTVFVAARDWNAADVAYRRSGPVVESLGHGLDRDPDPDGEPLGDVVVLVEHGFVPHPVEQSVVVVLPPSQVARLTDGSAGDRAAAAAEAAARILLAASATYGERSGHYRDRGYRSGVRLEPWRDDACDSGRGKSCSDEEGTPYLLRMSWPVLYQEPSSPAPVRVRAGDLGVDAATRLDLAASTRRDFDAARPAVLARTVLRAAAKLGLSTSLEAAVEEKDQGAGQLLGVLSNLGTLLMERADTRAWHLLPGSVSLVRLRLPAGSHELTLEADAARGSRGGGGSLGTVQVRPGTTTFVSTRLWH